MKKMMDNEYELSEKSGAVRKKRLKIWVIYICLSLL